MIAFCARVAQHACSIKFLALLMPILAHLILAQHQTGPNHSLNHQDQFYLQQVASRQQQQQNRIPRVGLAPQERPSCQLQPLAAGGAQKRLNLLTASGDSLAADHSTPQQQLATGAKGSAALVGDQQSIHAAQLDKASPASGATNSSQSITSTLIDQLISNSNSNNDNKQRRAQLNARVDTGERLRQLRQLLVSNNYDAYLVTPNDEHGSEYVTDYDRRLRFISGFTGSNGYALILLDRAVLFTDGRYALQAEADLDCNWWLVVSNEPLVDILAWLRSQGAKGLKVATDARLMSLQSFDYLEEQLKSRLDQSEFALISRDLVDVVWDNVQNDSSQQGGGGGVSGTSSVARELPSGKLFVQPLEFAGQISWQEKLMRLVAQMDRLKARHYVISKLDDIAWLLNLRGSDIPMSPLFKSYLLISRYPTTSTSATTGVGGGSLATMTTSAGVGGGPEYVRATPASGPITSIEQLLSTSGAGVGNGLQESGQSIPVLQAPQVLQVPTSQTIRVTFYVDLKKVTAQVREHLHLDNGTSYQQQQSDGGLASSQLSRIQVELRDYDVFIMDFRNRFASGANDGGGGGGGPASAPTTATMFAQGQPAGGKLLLDAMANVAIHVLAKNYEDRLILVEPLLQRLKSVKTDLEVAGMRQAHWRDSLAIAMLLAQLEQDIDLAKRTDKWTEQSAARELEFYRSLMDYNRGQSFDTISAYGPNGAIVHYKPPPVAVIDEQLDDHQAGKQRQQQQQLIGNMSTYLLDSGGQYLDGTTDITRTVHFGQPSEFQRETYTRVLMGAIDMMSLIFDQSPPNKTPWRLNDLMARRYLMELGLDYMHGTGHGIGAYSLVHEAPALIEHYASSSGGQRAVKQSSKLSNGGGGTGQQQQQQAGSIVLSEQLPIQANMFTSIEPGYYKANDFGIRLENIVVTQRVQPQQQQQQQQSGSSVDQSRQNSTAASTSIWLRFEPVSLVPFEPKLIKLELLSNKQKAWLNSYNLMVRLRMTQQINYYLTKMRQSSQQQQQHANQQVQVLGTASSSRLYEQLKLQAAGPNSTLAEDQDNQLGRNNYLRLEASKLQQLLEQAHKWIMAKTELIALDVPQRLIKAPNGNRTPISCQTTATSAEAAGSASKPEQPQASQATQANDGDEWSALGADPDGQRLMLAYMSSLPFNDADAARAAATLSARTGASGGGLGSGDQRPTTNDTSSGGAGGASSWYQGQKCTGIECDLLLLEALNSHQQSMQNHNQQQQQHQRRTGSAGGVGEWSAAQRGDERQSDEHKTSGGGLMDLFQLNSSSPGPAWWSLVNVWPFLGLGALLTLQLAVMAYVCAGGGRKPSDDGASQASSGSRSRRGSAASRLPSSRRGSGQLAAPEATSLSSIGANSPLSIVVTPENV